MNATKQSWQYRILWSVFQKLSIRIGDDTQWWIISQSYSWLFSIPQPNSCFAIYVRCNTAATAVTTKPQRFSSPIEFITHILTQIFPLTVCLGLKFSKTTLEQNNHFATLLWNLGVSPWPERRSRGQRRRGERASSGPPISLEAYTDVVHATVCVPDQSTENPFPAPTPLCTPMTPRRSAVEPPSKVLAVEPSKRRTSSLPVRQDWKTDRREGDAGPCLAPVDARYDRFEWQGCRYSSGDIHLR